MALLFLFTGVATGAAVIYSVYSSNQATKQAAASTQNGSKVSNANKLQGTKLVGFTPVSSVPTLQTTDLVQGTGATVQAGQTVSVQYTGAVAATGIIFQSSLDNGTAPISLSLNQVIEGWQKGIPGMKVGGTRQILIPADEAYGANPPQGSGIPVNAPLVFNVTVKSVQQ
jgi:peptidylprolyl isomerase